MAFNQKYSDAVAKPTNQYNNSNLYPTYVAPAGAQAFRSKQGSESEKIVRELQEIENHLYYTRYGNRIYEVDKLSYPVTANAAAEWVADDVLATTGVVVTRVANGTHTVIDGVQAVKVTVGSAFAGPVYVTHTMYPIIASGTHTSGANSTTTLTDANADFIKAGVAVGDVAFNETDGGIFTITAVTKTALTGTFDTLGTDDDFDVGDTYILRSKSKTYFDARPYKFIGMFMHADVAKAAADYSWRFRDNLGNNAVLDFPEILTADVWNYYDFELSQATFTNSAGTSITGDQFDWGHVQYLDFAVAAAVGVNEYVYCSEVLLYAKSNGMGPVLGRTIKAVSATANLTRGKYVYFKETSAMGKVALATTGVMADGICCTTDADVGQECEIQVDGPYLALAGAAITTPVAGDAVQIEDSAGTRVKNGAAGAASNVATIKATIAGDAGADESLLLCDLRQKVGTTPA